MRAVLAVLAALQSLSLFAAAHPYVIISTQITEFRVPSPAPTLYHERRQDFFDSLASAADSFFGITDDDQPTSTTLAKQKTSSSSSSNSVRTLLPPAVASTTASSRPSQTTSASDDNDEDTSTSLDDSTSTDSSTSTSTTSAISETTPTETTTTPSTTATPASSPSLGSLQPTNSPDPNKSNNSGGGITSGGIAVAVIMSLLIVGLAAWLIFRSHPKSKAWWAARKEKQFQERSYREALDGPGAGSPNLRQQALGSSRRQTLLRSFFAPATVKLGGGQEIKRKPVNWGAQSVSTPRLSDSEKTSMTASAAPMGQVDPVLLTPGHGTPAAPTVAHTVSPMSMRPRESFDQLAPVSPMSSHRELPPISAITNERDLPSLPPMPVIPHLVHAKKGSDGVFRLS